MIKNKVEDYLLADGVNPAYKGFLYLTEAIMAYEPAMSCMKLYKIVAEKCHCTDYTVDRDIRLALMKREPKKENMPNSKYIALAKIKCSREG